MSVTLRTSFPLLIEFAVDPMQLDPMQWNRRTDSPANASQLRTRKEGTMGQKPLDGKRPPLASHSRSRSRALSRGRSRTRRSSPTGRNGFFSPAWIDVQSSYYSGAEYDDDESSESETEHELVTQRVPVKPKRRQPRTEEDGMIFNMIDQINDIKVRNLSNRNLQPGAIEEEMEKEKELDEKVADDADTIISSDLESPLPTKEPAVMEQKPKDPNLVITLKMILNTSRTDVCSQVTFDGPDDPLNPKNWTNKKRWLATLSVATFTFISPLTSSMVAPALPQISEEFHITSTVESQIVLSIFVLAFAIGPLILGPLSEVYGRVTVLQASNVFYLVFNTAAGFSQNKVQMMVFRCLSGLGGSAPLAIGGGVLGDLFKPEERGKAMALYGLGPLLGPSIGPIAGGWIAMKTTWRWMFWAVSIADLIIFVFGIFNLKESYAPHVLHLKAKRLRRETGNPDLRTEFETPERASWKFIPLSIMRSFRLLFTQPIVQVLAVYMAYSYGLMYLVLATFPPLFQQTYHESLGIAGLNYISLGLGFFFGAPLCGKTNDVIYQKLKARHAPLPGRPEYRMPLMIPFSLLVPFGLFLYGWSAQYRLHWILPNIGAFFFAAGTIAAFQCVQTYLVDAYTRYAASAIGAVTVLRSLCGFGFPLFAPTMYEKLGYGWGNSALGFVALVVGLPSPALMYWFGERLRRRSPFAAG
ncbi:MAG: hypothetical protein Q9160_003864 [Pyrenula sp. 1 TL-2023]